MRDVAILGRDHIKVDSLDKVLGRAKFAADYYMPDMLYGNFNEEYTSERTVEETVMPSCSTRGMMSQPTPSSWQVSFSSWGLPSPL